MVSFAKRDPTFMIVGAPKCGTTALYEYLQAHPQVFVSDPKEPHFYAEDLGAHRSVFTRAEYHKLFALARPELASGRSESAVSSAT